MANYCVFTRAEAPQFAKLLMFLFDLPKKGVHVGGGIHVPMPDQAPNPCPKNVIGWTTRHFSWIAKPSNNGSPTDEFAVRITPDLQEAWVAKRSQLTTVQRNWVQNHIDTASDLELIAAWKKTVQQPDGTMAPSLVETDDVDPEP